MAKEIERKFLVTGTAYQSMARDKRLILQGYLSRNAVHTVRVRIIDDWGFLTVKGKTHGCTRDEFEYPIPIEDALQILKLCGGRIIEKTRWYVPYAGRIWEVDEFGGELKGLVVAEIELTDENQEPELPPFIGEEVTGQAKYYNSNL